MTALELAVEHCAHLDAIDQQAFLIAFGQARHLEKTGGDVEAAWFTARNDSAAAAGHIEGITSTRTYNPPRKDTRT